MSANLDSDVVEIELGITGGEEDGIDNTRRGVFGSSS